MRKNWGLKSKGLVWDTYIETITVYFWEGLGGSGFRVEGLGPVGPKP